MAVTLPGELEDVRRSLEAHGFTVTNSFYDAKNFGNILFDLDLRNLRVRITRDRRQWIIEILVISHDDPLEPQLEIVADSLQLLGPDFNRDFDLVAQFRSGRESAGKLVYADETV